MAALMDSGGLDGIDIEGYEEPYTDEGMSEEEEEYLDYLLGDIDDGDEELDFTWTPNNQYRLLLLEYHHSLQMTASQKAARRKMEVGYTGGIITVDDGAPDPRSVQFRPNRKPGLQLGRLSRQMLRGLSTPIHFFRLFLTGYLITNLCLSTNQNARYLIDHGNFKSYAKADGTWELVTELEMEKFIGILIYMSFMKLSSVDRYWSRDVLYKGNPISAVMTITRFKAILTFLQITPLPDVDKENKLTRIDPLINHVNQKSQELFQPYEKIAVDERIVKSKHKMSGIRQFMKDKPVKFGIKLWVLADTITGYTCNFYVYLGKKRTQIANLTKGLAYSVVMNLIPDYVYQGYRLFIDSFYTTKNLIYDLLDKRVYTIGAVRSNSSAMPVVFKSKDGWDKLACRGDYRWHRDDKFLIVQWKDCKVVTIVSPIHQGHKLSSCVRTFQARTGWKKQAVKQPECVQAYNEGMFGVDKSNQYLSKYQCYIKTKFHWWKVLFFHCLDIMIVNSYVLFEEFRNEHPNLVIPLPSHFGQLEFREFLVKSLISIEVPVEVELACTPVFNEASKRQRCTYCYAFAKLNDLPNQNNRTVFRCEKCNVSLCLLPDRNCFKKWHNIEGCEVQAWFREHGRGRDNV